MATDARPQKPTPDFPLFPHANGQWAKKIHGKLRYFGSWDDPDVALAKYLADDHGTRKQTSVPASTSTAKPRKPHPDYPLYPHASGQWAKKVRGRVHYFGAWDDPDAALSKWLDQKDALLSGRVPAPTPKELTILALVNAFLSTKKAKVEAEEMEQRTWDDYDWICGEILKVFGPGRLVDDLRPDDFAALRKHFAKTHGKVSLLNDITRARVVFNWAFRQYLVGQAPRYGDSFSRPSQKVLRLERKKNGKRMFEVDQLRGMLDKAGIQLRAMMYLGINCGFGNHDCGTLPRQVLDLENGWVDYARSKTGIDRRCPLWPETTEALRAYLTIRPEPKPEFAHLVFITRCKRGWEQKNKLSRKGKAIVDDPISKETAKVLKALGIHRRGLNFYALRHTFQTIGEKSRDKDAVRFIMGHAPAANDMSVTYNEEAPDDARLLAVVNHVHDWLFPRSPCKIPSPQVASASGLVSGEQGTLTASE